MIKVAGGILLPACLACALALHPRPVEECDLCVYGGTASGVVSAKAAAIKGLKVIVVEPTNQLGGMTTGGLGHTDIGNKSVVKGLALKFYRELGKHYGSLENWVFEPSRALAVIDGFAAQKGVDTILLGYHLQGVRKSGTRIRSIDVTNGDDALRIKAKWFIDASYEGDLMAGSGVSYRIGREDNSEYSETWNGSQFLTKHQFPDGVDPFVVPGDPASGLLWGISPQRLKPDGTGDSLVQAYNYRICLTDDPDNIVPIEKPDNYDPSKYELLVRLFEAQKDRRAVNDYFIWSRMPNRKTDINNRGGFSTDMIGMNYGYPDGSWEQRREIIKAHKDYTLGLLYFVAHDERVPAGIREEVSRWGLPKDEYVNNGHWTPQLYVRESRRMVGEYVATQADCENVRIATDGVAYAAYTMDSHNTERIVIRKDGRYMVKNEGDAQIHGGLPYPISYRSITPRREECTNLLVPVCLSASHIAYGSIRMEPVFMCLGQASGIAVAVAEEQGLKRIQDLDYRRINEVFEKDPYMDGSVPDIVLDDSDASVSGEWNTVTGTRGWGPTSLKCISGQGTVEFKGRAEVSGEYAVYNYTHFTNFKRPAGELQINPLAEIVFPDGSTVCFDASKFDLSNIGQASSCWVPVGKIKLEPGEEFSFVIRGGAKTVADAILLVRQ